MAAVFKILFYVILFALCIGIFNLIIFYTGKLPCHMGVVHVDKDSGNATVYRLLDGIPHVHSDEEPMAYYALGYSIASDRMFQLDKLRRVAQGRLSEMFGEPTIEVDKALRNLGFEELAEKTYNSISDRTRTALDEYSQGINDYNKLFSLGIDYWLLGISINNETVIWKPTDSLSIYLFSMFGLSDSYDIELYRDYLYYKLQDQELVDKILPIGSHFEVDEIKNVISDSELKKLGFYKDNGINMKPSQRERKTYEFIENNIGEEIEYLKTLKNTYSPGASNCWAISGKYTKSGKPMLVNDPHLKPAIPSNFYLAEVNINGNFIIGAMMPGVPIFVSARTNKVSYGATALNSDSFDLYEEKIEGDKYLFKGKWLDLDTSEEVIKVRDGTDQIITIRKTHHGPILDHVGSALSQILPQFSSLKFKVPVSLSWIGYTTEDPNFLDSLIKFESHETVYDLIEASKGTSGSAYGACLADHKGNIGYSP